MALPKQRHTRHRRDRARRELALKPTDTVSCPKCGAKKLKHRVCPKCGTYKGREVVKTGPSLKKNVKKGSEEKKSEGKK